MNTKKIKEYCRNLLMLCSQYEGAGKEDFTNILKSIELNKDELVMEIERYDTKKEIGGN